MPEWTRLQDVFHAALEQPPESRDAFLDDACNTVQLREEVDALLEAHDPDDELEDVGAALELGRDPQPGERIAGYELQDILGSGGMGTVYRARQESPSRDVAFKVMRRGFGDEEALRRFEHESQILGRLRHPSIAQVYAAGVHTSAGRTLPWFAMELVESAQTLDSRGGRPLRQNLELFARICEGVHHGHQKGVIHRDLKPANVLIDSHGDPKIIDFGVAKVSGGELGSQAFETAAGQLIGTPSYMSPEQAAGSADALDIRTDVYSLGVVLYQLLTRVLPHDLEGKTLVEALKAVAETDVDPLPLNGLPPDVRTIILQALQRDRDRRYPSASAFAEDVRRYLAAEPIRARPPSALYLARTFARRHRLLFAAGTSIVVALGIGVAGTTWGLVEARAEHQAAEDARTRAEQARDEAVQGREFLAEMLYAADPWRGKGPEVRLRDALDQASARLDDPEAIDARLEVDLRSILGEIYGHLGAPDKAEEHLRRALELRRAAGDDGATMLATAKLASALADLDRLEEAETLANEAVAWFERERGPRHAETSGARGTLAGIWRQQGRLDEGLALSKDVLDVRTRELGADHPDTIRSRNNLATVLYERGEYVEAERLFREVLVARERQLGNAHPQTLSSVNNLASTLHHLDKLEEAGQHYRRALDGKTKALGADHEQTLVTLSAYGSLLRLQEDYEGAIDALRRAHAGRERTLGENHRETLSSLSNLAAALSVAGELEEAEATARRCLELWERRTEGSKSGMVDPMSNLARILLERGKTDEAITTFERAVSVAHETLGDNHWKPWAVESNHGQALARVGRTTEAKEVLERSRRRLVELRGAENRWATRAAETLRKLEAGESLENP